jgi:hypothetical protein
LKHCIDTYLLMLGLSCKIKVAKGTLQYFFLIFDK